MMVDKKRYVIFSIKFIFSLFLGLVMTILVMQNDQWVKNIVENYITNGWGKRLECEMTCKVDSINFFRPCVTFDTFAMKAYDDSWRWEAGNLTVGFGWLDLLFSGGLDLFIHMKDIVVDSLAGNDGLSIVPHALSLLKGSSFIVPIFFKSFEIKKGVILIKDSQSQMEARLPLSIMVKNIDGVLRSKISCKGGCCSAYGKDLVSDFSGPLVCNVSQKLGHTHAYVDCNCTFDAPFIPGNKTCFLYGKWNYDQGLFCVKNQDYSFVVDPIKVYFLADSLFVSFEVDSDLKNIVAPFGLDKDIAGRCSMQFSSEFGSYLHSKRGQVVVSGVSYKGIDLFTLAKLSFNKGKTTWNGNVSVLRDDVAIGGTCMFNEKTGECKCKLHNETEIETPLSKYWKVASKKSNIAIQYDPTKKCDITYAVQAKNEKLNADLGIAGTVNVADTINLQGTINDHSYEAVLDAKKVRIQKCSYKDKACKTLFSLDALSDDFDKLKGRIAFPLIKSLIKDYCNYDITGNSDLNVDCALKDGSVLCRLTFKDGSISLPSQYNFLNGFSMSFKFDPNNRSIFVKDMAAKLHKGSLTCSKAVVEFDEHYKTKFFYVPFLFENCLVNVENDLFALVSGRATLNKKPNSMPTLNGLIFIDKSQMKKNIFASNLQKQLASSPGGVFESEFKDMMCDISVMSKDPLRINTSFLQANANIDLKLKKSILSPEISGKIDFISGSMSFPYKPLYISKGSLYFLPQQAEDPIVEIVAKNKINKYNVTMYVTGSMLKHNISLESAPSLSEEQIVSLLIAGSAQESMNSVMPALIMQNITNLIFGSDQSKAGVGRYFKRIFKPFKNVYIVPSFADQTGRGGLRGSIEIDINERWKAFVQKNFSLSEDTRFEIEYLLSDDVSVRGVRAENGDIGGEVEMKWKF